jgi:hypothetical protein
MKVLSLRQKPALVFFRAMIKFITVGGRIKKGNRRLPSVLGEFFGEKANPAARTESYFRGKSQNF